MRFLLNDNHHDHSGTIRYTVWENDRQVGHFSYRITEDARFYVEAIWVDAADPNDRIFRAIINFLEYKAAVSHTEPVYIRIHEKNEYLLDRYLANGFYSIDTEITVDDHGNENRILILRNR